LTYSQGWWFSYRMISLSRLQLLGPIVLCTAIVCAEAAAWALSFFPTVQVLWYINVRLFGLFQHGYYPFNKYIDLPGAPLFEVILILLLSGVGYYFNKRMLLAIGSNLSFVYTAVLVYSTLNFSYGSAPIRIFTINPQLNLYLATAIFAAASISMMASHLIYIQQFFSNSSSSELRRRKSVG